MRRSYRARLHNAIASCLVLLASASSVEAFSIKATSIPGNAEPRLYAPGTSALLSIQFSSVPAGERQWFHDDKPIAGAISDSLLLTQLSSSDTGNYRLRITSGEVVQFSEETLTINVVALPPAPIEAAFDAEMPTTLNVRGVYPGASDGSLLLQCFPKTDVTDYGNSRSVTRLRANGNWDSPFNFWLGTNTLLLALPDGGFLTVNSPYRHRDDGSSAPFNLPAGFDTTKPLDAAVALPDGRIIVAQRQLLARVNADGTVDATFSTDLKFDSIRSLQIDAKSRIIVYASMFDTLNSLTSGILDRLLSTGARDTTFHGRSAIREYYYPSILPDGGLFLERYWSNFEGPLFSRLNEDGTAVAGWKSSFDYLEDFKFVFADSAQPNAFFTRDLRRYLITDTGITPDPAFYAGILGEVNAVLASGRLLVTRNIWSADGNISKKLVQLRTTDKVTATPPPDIEIGLFPVTPKGGSPLTFFSTVTGTGTVSYQWLALDGQPLPADSTSPNLVIPSFSTAHFGRYQLRVTGPGGVSVLSGVREISVERRPSYLTNLSGRAMTGSGEDTVIAGVVTKTDAGVQGLPALLRGVGPALKPLGVSNFLPNPALDVFNSSGTLMANNDQWSVDPSVAAVALELGAFAFAENSSDAALLHYFPTGSATIMLKNQGQGDGIGMIEVYHRLAGSEIVPRQLLRNLSFRARTGPGEATAIAGFVISDPLNFARPAKVLLRAVGPSLGAQGIVRPLENPVLTVYNSKGETVAQNDDWSANNSSANATDLAAAMKRVGAFTLPANSKDSALLLDLPASAYTLHATGGTGVVLLEIYIVD